VLAGAIDDPIVLEFCAYSLQAVDNVDESALLTFAQWIRGRRDEGIDLRLRAVEPHEHHLLEGPLGPSVDRFARRRRRLWPPFRARRSDDRTDPLAQLWARTRRRVRRRPILPHDAGARNLDGRG